MTRPLIEGPVSVEQEGNTLSSSGQRRERRSDEIKEVRWKERNIRGRRVSRWIQRNLKGDQEKKKKGGFDRSLRISAAEMKESEGTNAEVRKKGFIWKNRMKVSCSFAPYLK